MNPRSSQVLALANWPAVELTDLSSAAPEDLTNLATGFTYEPGSTFKAFTVAAALEEGLVTPETMFDLPPTLQVADRKIEESHERGYVRSSVADILAQSSNVGAVKIGLEVGSDFDHWIRQLDSVADRSPAPGGGSCPRSRTTRARRWATCRSARASR